MLLDITISWGWEITIVVISAIGGCLVSYLALRNNPKIKETIDEKTDHISKI